MVAGVNVGSIDSVEFMDDGRVEVRFSVVDDAAALIFGACAGATAGTFEEGDQSGLHRQQGHAGR